MWSAVTEMRRSPRIRGGDRHPERLCERRVQQLLLGTGEGRKHRRGAGNAVTFSNVTVPSAGTYLLEVDYATSGPRSFFLTINNGTANELDLNGSTFDEPTYTVLRVHLNAGTNTLRFDNATGYAPDLDRIVAAPTVLGDLLGEILH